MTEFSVFSRRAVLGFGISALTAAAAPKVWAQAAAPAAPTGPFSLPKRAYEANALEPHIDAATMDIHYNRHHAAYVAALNNAAKDNGVIAKASVGELLADLNQLPENLRTLVRNNGGGHANHTMFWEVMGPGAGGAPTGDVAAAITKDLGGFDKFKADFEAAGLRVFGSGWVFVTVDKDGKLALLAKPNQDSPIMEKQMVLFGNDVWEHAYYLKYQNRRADYLKGWWNVVNWAKVNERYAAAKAGKLAI
ncbi:superoxide dismutase [Bosea sp. NBC_00550]|uniref:superoxide dismutase n=1 Tax=Bosea sp. NBC_00550 TaxID=2969621 RepID=UPI002230D495|nr:superoxide dismutase [Bosea sp. NBC_00550]UZF94547.1 superoxide dismutase [Bosea sp. NBC_00550]